MSGVAAKLPRIDDDIERTFLPEMFPAMPGLIETDQLVITRGYHDYGAWGIDHPQVSGPKPVYEALGIATAAVLLKPDLDELKIRLTNSNSEIRELRIAFSHSVRPPFGLHRVPVMFDYFQDQVVRHPWLHESVQHPDHYPQFVLTNADDFLANEHEWKNRDVLLGLGSAQGRARMIQLFLDISRQSKDCTEVVLEAEPGFRGVAPASAEIRFWLPESDYFIDTNFS